MVRAFRRSRALLLAAALLGVAGGMGPASAEDKPIDPKLMGELVKAMRAYLQLDADPYNGREATRAAIAKIEAGGGPKVLSDMAALRRATDQGRDFDADYRDRKWQKQEANTEVNEGKVAINVSRPDKLRLAFSVPKKDYNDAALAKIPRVEAFPTLITLIEEKDYTGKKFPGEEAIARRYGTMKEVLEHWLLFAPVAVRGNYIEDGKVRQLFFTAQFKDFYQRFHVDFERVVLDGDATTATTIAASQPYMYAGIVLRRPLSGEPKVDPDVVTNYANVPVYVVGCPQIEGLLKDAGHPDVTRGDEAGLPAWLAQRKRVVPRKFTWRVKASDQVFANWLWFAPDWSQEDRSLTVEVFDTPEDPNTVRITTRGILDLTALLNDDIVDLGREVRFVINGKQVAKEKLDRSLERVFDRPPVKAREAVFYGLLFTALSPQMFAPPPEEPAKPTQAAPADPEREAKARGWLDKAEELAAGGNKEKAIEILQRLLKDLADTSVAAEATKRLAGLQGK
ncbi:MAG: hypothetical protein ACKOSS_10705 [Planctomycetia bacterium]